MNPRFWKVPRTILQSLAISVFLCFLPAEFLIRRIDRLRDRVPPLVSDERNLMYRYDEILGWFPVANSERCYTGNVSVTVHHNSQGFRDREHGPRSGRRIAFFGDSLVWGYDVEERDRFTELLQEHIPDWEILNLGVSGYGTDQEFLLLQKEYGRYQPDLVFFVFCSVNDRFDNRTNRRYGGYYKPYFTQSGVQLTLQGVPVPKSINYYAAACPFLFRSFCVRLSIDSVLRRIQPEELQLEDPTEALFDAVGRFVESRGSTLIVGLQAPDPTLTEHLRSQHLPYVDLDTPFRFPKFGQHWTPEGHRVVAEKVFAFLADKGYLLARKTSRGPGIGP